MHSPAAAAAPAAAAPAAAASAAAPAAAAPDALASQWQWVVVCKSTAIRLASRADMPGGEMQFNLRLFVFALTTLALLRADTSGLKSTKFPCLKLNAKHWIRCKARSLCFWSLR
jgi:hypothetical protein